MFLQEISVQVQERSDICSVSTRESVDCMKVSLQEKVLHTVDLLHVQKQQDMVFCI